jgi:hypothetical protein
MTDCDLLKIDKKAMIEALHREHTFSDLFVSYLLARNIRYEKDLVACRGDNVTADAAARIGISPLDLPELLHDAADSG